MLQTSEGNIGNIELVGLYSKVFFYWTIFDLGQYLLWGVAN